MYLLCTSIIFISLVAITYLVAKLIQLQFYTKFLRWEIEELFAGDRWETEDICLDQSFEALKRSMPWNYNFDSITVYTKRK